MAVGPYENDGIVGSDLVEIGSRRKNRRLPERLDPAAPFEPLSAFLLRHLGLHRGEKGIEARDTFQVERGFTLPDAGEVHVGVDETREHRSPFEIDDAGRHSLIGGHLDG
jgi:hypothetical protein